MSPSQSFTLLGLAHHGIHDIGSWWNIHPGRPAQINECRVDSRLSQYGEGNVTGGRFIIVGLYADYRGKSLGWISEEYLLNESKRGKLAPGWDVQIIKSTQAKLTLPIVIFEKRIE